MNECEECGMLTESDEYHPYAACLMFIGCRDSETVRANLNAVVLHRMTADRESTSVTIEQQAE